MSIRFVLSEYLENALDQAEYEKLEDGTYAGTIPVCRGVVAFSESLQDCERELRSVLEDWLLLGLKLGHRLPVVGGIDLNKGMTHAEVESLSAPGFHPPSASTWVPGGVQGDKT